MCTVNGVNMGVYGTIHIVGHSIIFTIFHGSFIFDKDTTTACLEVDQQCLDRKSTHYF